MKREYSITAGQKYDYKNKEKNVQDYVNYTLNRALAMFHYEGLPDTVPAEILEKYLLSGGFAIWGKVNGEVYVFQGGLGGEEDVYYRPTIATVANPALNLSANWKIDSECVVMQNDPMYMGLLPLFNRYCTLINENDITMMLADVNRRVSFLLSATDDNTADSARKFLKAIIDGEQGVITDNQIMQGLKVETTQQAKDSIMDLVEYQQYLRAGLYNEIGLNSNFNMKRERLTANEVEMNSGNLYPLVDRMLDCRRTALEKVNKMFGLDITVDFASSWTMRAEEVETPPQDEADPPQDEADPPQEETDPPQDEADPPQDEADPPQDEADPPQEDEKNETV